MTSWKLDSLGRWHKGGRFASARSAAQHEAYLERVAEHERRSAASRAAWARRREREAAEHERRSEAARRGWQTRRAAKKPPLKVEFSHNYFQLLELDQGADPAERLHVNITTPAGVPIFTYDGPRAEFAAAELRLAMNLHMMESTGDGSGYWRGASIFTSSRTQAPDTRWIDTSVTLKPEYLQQSIDFLTGHQGTNEAIA